MTRAYIIQRYPTSHEPDSFDDIINDIKKTNPDKIIVMSMGEINVEYIFQVLFKNIHAWLITNNKYLYVLWPGPDEEIYPHIMGVSNLGSAYGNIACVKSRARELRNIDWSQSDKLFVSYHHNCKYERKVLVDMFAKHDLLKDGIVTFAYPERCPEYQWKYHDGSKLTDEPDYVLNSKPEFSAAMLPKNYMRGFIDIVAETDSVNGRFVPTEKNAKPWAALKPYLVLSSMHYHKWLYEEYGIEMYHELFDYSFDNLPKVEDRINGIVDNLLRIRNELNNPNYKTNIIKQIESKLFYNRTMAMNVLETLNKKGKIIPDCLKFIIEEDNYELLGETHNHQGNLHFMTDKNWLLNPIVP
jgi:hypothetical protein